MRETHELDELYQYQMSKKEEKKLIAVYGSLKKGHYNFDRFLKDQEFVGETTTEGAMQFAGSISPLATCSENSSLVNTFNPPSKVPTTNEPVNLFFSSDIIYI